MSKDIRYVIKVSGTGFEREAYLCKDIYNVANGWKPSLTTCMLNITSDDFKGNSVAKYKTKQGAEKKIRDAIDIVENGTGGLIHTKQIIALMEKAEIIAKDFTKTNNIEFACHHTPVYHSKARLKTTHCSGCGIVLEDIPYASIRVNSYGTANLCYTCLCAQKESLESYWNALPKERQDEINGEIFLHKLKAK